MKYLKKFNESFNESIALDYLKRLYQIGGISSDVYDMVKHEDEDHLISFDEIGDSSKIKKKVLKHLNNVGAISTDVYELEMENISENKFILEEFDRDGYKSHWNKFRGWLSEKDFELYDGEEDLYNKFMEVANDDELAIEDKADALCNYLEDKWGLYGGYQDVWEYLDQLFGDEI
jgi:hypothetical protein